MYHVRPDPVVFLSLFSDSVSENNPLSVKIRSFFGPLEPIEARAKAFDLAMQQTFLLDN